MYFKNVGISYIDKDADTIARLPKTKHKGEEKKEEKKSIYNHNTPRKRKKSKNLSIFQWALLFLRSSVLCDLYDCFSVWVTQWNIYTYIIHIYLQSIFEHQMNDKVFHIRH